jgi:hypothetical protein
LFSRFDRREISAANFVSLSNAAKALEKFQLNEKTADSRESAVCRRDEK